MTLEEYARQVAWIAERIDEAQHTEELEKYQAVNEESLTNERQKA